MLFRSFTTRSPILRCPKLRRTFELLDAVYQALTEKRTGTVPQAQSENESEEAQEHEHEYEQDEAMQDQQDQAGRQQEQRQHHDTSKEENPEKTRLDPSTFDRTDVRSRFAVLSQMLTDNCSARKAD